MNLKGKIVNAYAKEWKFLIINVRKNKMKKKN